MAGNIDVFSLPETILYFRGNIYIGISALRLVYSFLLCYLLKIILIADSDVSGL